MLRRTVFVALVLTLGAGLHSSFAKCEPTKHVSIKGHEATGEGCTKSKARAAAEAALVNDNCTGEDDPKCEGRCRKGCKIVGRDFSNLKVTYEPIDKKGCTGGHGWKCTLSANFNCGCSCK